MAKENKNKEEIVAQLTAVSNSLRVIGSGEGLVEEVNTIIERIKKDL